MLLLSPFLLWLNGPFTAPTAQTWNHTMGGFWTWSLSVSRLSKPTTHVAACADNSIPFDGRVALVCAPHLRLAVWAAPRSRSFWVTLSFTPMCDYPRGAPRGSLLQRVVSFQTGNCWFSANSVLLSPDRFAYSHPLFQIRRNPDF